MLNFGLQKLDWKLVTILKHSEKSPNTDLKMKRFSLVEWALSHQSDAKVTLAEHVPEEIKVRLQPT